MDRLPPHLSNIIGQLREGLRELYGDRFRDLLLYGSYARGDAREGSDIDLLILLKGPVDTAQEICRIVDLSAPLSLDHGVLLSVMPVSEEAYEKGNTAFLRTVRREAVQAA